MAELALVFPIFALVLFSIFVLGVAIFYQQQLANAAREAARFAVVNSATAQCPVVSWHDPAAPSKPLSYKRCDPPQTGWPKLVAHARSKVWGMDRSKVYISACWSGYQSPTGVRDQPPTDESTSPPAPNPFVDCTIGGLNPHTQTDTIPCPPPATSPSDDTASDLAASQPLHNTNRVTVYVCYPWSPPLSGFLVIPNTFVFRTVLTEVIHHQQ
ncbi:MAG TPA: TadE family protein [Candidatus Limnocylindrales bacterium]|nr:TadE family protein [Candidatus Limnocylindrales bacterium]